jgi:DNA-binding MurR/RpiR family transcriptional regulator
MSEQSPGMSTNCLLYIQGIYESMRPSEKQISNYILEQPQRIIHFSVTELAKRVGVSDATIVKFCQKLDYKGYQDFKIALAKELNDTKETRYGEIEAHDDIEVIKEKIINTECEALQNTMRVLQTAELEQAVEMISNARLIHIYGVGASGFVALDAETKFLRIGLNCNAFMDPHQQIAFAALLGKEDAAIGISYSGATKDTVKALKVAKQSGAATMCITNCHSSPITKVAGIKLFTSCKEGRFRSGAMASRLAQLAVIDVIFVAVAVKRYDLTLKYLERTRQAVFDEK